MTNFAQNCKLFLTWRQDNFLQDEKSRKSVQKSVLKWSQKYNNSVIKLLKTYWSYFVFF